MHLTLEGISVRFNTADGEYLDALGPVSAGIEAGSFVALVGPSGCGKSTLIRVLAGLQKPTSGQALADGVSITEPHDRIALMFQDANLMPWRTVLDNIALPLELKGIAKTERQQRVHEILPALGLEDFAQAYPMQLSGGMAQRAALGRILIQRPEVLLLDEPFGALDSLTREKISFDLLQLWRQYRPTVVMVTHDINEAVLLADRVWVFSTRPGRIETEFASPLERPRQLDMIYTQPYLETVRSVREALHQA